MKKKLVLIYFLLLPIFSVLSTIAADLIISGRISRYPLAQVYDQYIRAEDIYKHSLFSLVLLITCDFYLFLILIIPLIMWAIFKKYNINKTIIASLILFWFAWWVMPIIILSATPFAKELESIGISPYSCIPTE